MKTRVETLTDIPTNELETASSEFHAAGGVVTAFPQPNGMWTLIAIFQEAT